MQEFTQETTYKALLTQRGRGFTELEVTELLQQILPQLAQLHSQGLAHGGISLDTLTLDQQTQRATLASPERSSTQPNPSDDVYALGVSAISLLTNQSPLQGDWQDACLVSDQLAEVLERAIAPEPHICHANAMQMQQALNAPVAMAYPVATQYVAQPNVQVVSPSSTGTKLNLAGWQWGAIGAGGALLLGLAVFGVFSMVAPKSEVPAVSNSPTEVSPSPNGGQSSPAPEGIAEPNLGSTINPFEQVGFPQAVCGDSLPVGQQYYPVNLYPVFLDYSEGNLQMVQRQFCQDALKKIRQGTGKLSVQVASFLTLERAEFFRTFMARRFGNAEIGQPTTILSDGRGAP